MDSSVLNVDQMNELLDLSPDASPKTKILKTEVEVEQNGPKSETTTNKIPDGSTEKGVKRTELTSSSTKKPQKLIKKSKCEDKEKMKKKMVNPDKKESKDSRHSSARLRDFNSFVREFVDRNLDRMVPISKQPKEKIQAIIDSCVKRYPEFEARTRNRVRNYLKSCRRAQVVKFSKPDEGANSQMDSSCLLAMADVSQSVGDNHTLLTVRGTSFMEEEKMEKAIDQQKQVVCHTSLQQDASISQRTPEASTNLRELLLFRDLAKSYRESADFLLRAAKELEDKLKRSQDIRNK